MKTDFEFAPEKICCDCDACDMPCLQSKDLGRSCPRPPIIIDPGTHGHYNAEFQKIYKTHHKRIYALTYRMLRNKEDAEDIAQETFVRAYSNYKKLDPRAPVFAWLCKIATNLCIDMARKNKNIHLLSLEGCYISELLEIRAYRLMNTINLGEKIEMEETVALINTAMDTMPPHYCQVLVLRGCENVSSKEVAKIMDISISAVDVLLHRARKRFKKIYRELSVKHYNAGTS